MLRTPKKREALPDVLDRRELARLLADAERGDVWRRSFPASASATGSCSPYSPTQACAKAKLLGLDWDDVDFERRLIRVRRAKDGRQRTVPIHPALEPLFFIRYAARPGVTERKRSPRTHSPARLRLQAPARGANLRQIQELLEHEYLDSAQRYTRVTARAIKRLNFDRRGPCALEHERPVSRTEPDSFQTLCR